MNDAQGPSVRVAALVRMMERVAQLLERAPRDLRLTLLAPWDGVGMAATQSHAMRLERAPAVRLARLQGRVRHDRLLLPPLPPQAAGGAAGLPDLGDLYVSCLRRSGDPRQGGSAAGNVAQRRGRGPPAGLPGRHEAAQHVVDQHLGVMRPAEADARGLGADDAVGPDQGILQPEVVLETVRPLDEVGLVGMALIELAQEQQRIFI